jgi:hypothetical protein
MAAASAIITTGIVRGDIPEGLGAVVSILAGVAGGYIAADSLTKGKE